MSKDLRATVSAMKNNEDVVTILMKELSEKKRILDEAHSMYNRICLTVENANLELTGIKMKCFKMESLLQEAEIRVRVFDKMEKEVQYEAERAKTAIREAEIRHKQEYAARDAYNHSFIKKVVEMAEDYCRLKASCDEKSVSDSFLELKAAFEQLSHEIDTILKEMGGEGGDNHVSLVSPDPADEQTLADVRELQKAIQEDIRRAELSNAMLKAQVNQLEQLKVASQKEIETLKEILGK